MSTPLSLFILGCILVPGCSNNHKPKVSTTPITTRDTIVKVQPSIKVRDFQYGFAVIKYKYSYVVDQGFFSGGPRDTTVYEIVFSDIKMIENTDDEKAKFLDDFEYEWRKSSETRIFSTSRILTKRYVQLYPSYALASDARQHFILAQ